MRKPECDMGRAPGTQRASGLAHPTSGSELVHHQPPGGGGRVSGARWVSEKQEHNLREAADKPAGFGFGGGVLLGACEGGHYRPPPRAVS